VGNLKVWVLVLSLSFFLSTLIAGDIRSQWRGPQRDGIYAEKDLLSKWPAAGPSLVWTAENLGEGFSSAAVTEHSIYITGMRTATGYLTCLDHKGKQRWQMTYGPEWDGGHDGARTTPTVVDDKIYLMSGEGKVVCVDTRDGKINWQVDLIRTFAARNLEWGMTESLLVDGDRVFCTPGGQRAMMVILNRDTGKTIKVIEGNGEESAYCSPVLIAHNGKPLVLTMTAKSVVGIDAISGDYLWKYTHKTRYDINPNTPLYHEGSIYSVSGYGTGGQLYRLSPDGKKVTKVWANKTMDSQTGSAVLMKGYLYGSGHENKGWHCVEWQTGKLMYTSKELGRKGNIICADGFFYCYDENGSIGLVRPNPQKFDLISAFKIEKGTGPHWAHPVISGGYLYVRHGDALMVYDIKAK
jgi:outer membrane protein assembly factor BamB